jgi:GPH family glycoside/pentoside/hexuronide:cation symporter
MRGGMNEKLPQLTKWIYGFGDLGFSMTSTILGAYFAIFLTDVVGLPVSVAAIAIFIGRSWDYINDPLIGYLSDRTRSRWGRRRPFLLFGPLPFAIAFMMLWWLPPIASETGLAIYYAFAYLVFDAAATMVYMPYFALTPELTQDYDERTSLTSYRMVFSILGSLAAFILPMMIINSLVAENAHRVSLMGVVFGVCSAIPLWLVFARTRERPGFQPDEKPNLRSSIKAAVKNKPFMFGAGIYLITWVTISIIEASLLYYIKFVVHREAQSDLIMAAIFVSALITLPIWNWVSGRYNKRIAYIIGISFWAVVQIILITLTPETPMAVVIWICVMAGIGVGAAHVLPWAIVPDAIEWDEYQTGERHEGMFYSLITLMQKVAASIAVPLALLILEASGYVPKAAIQPESAIQGIRIIVGPLPAVLLLIGIVFAWRYPLNREAFKEIVDTLKKRRIGESA